MNYLKLLFIPTIFPFTMIANVSGQLNAKDTTGGYKLVWADEFSKEGKPDVSNWKFKQGFVRNHELQWYQPQNAWCKDGLLIIEARREKLPNPNYDSTSSSWKNTNRYIEYTSSSLNTKDLHSWKFGRFVMRGKIDTYAGLWPAFWTLGISREWPSNGEIDIMEYYKNNLLANIACGTQQRYKAKWYSKSTPLLSFNDPSWSSKFHIWRMDWDENAISLFVDDQLLNKTELKQLYNPDETNPFERQQYLLLNLAIGGDNGGDPAGTTFPRHFLIDYVRVYQK
jgi:beta-glucanase (GH16 family)